MTKSQITPSHQASVWLSVAQGMAMIPPLPTYVAMSCPTSVSGHFRSPDPSEQQCLPVAMYFLPLPQTSQCIMSLYLCQDWRVSRASRKPETWPMSGKMKLTVRRVVSAFQEPWASTTPATVTTRRSTVPTMAPIYSNERSV